MNRIVLYFMETLEWAARLQCRWMKEVMERIFPPPPRAVRVVLKTSTYTSQEV